MRKKMVVMFACATAGVIPSLPSASRAGSFVDNFNNGNYANSDTIPNFWTFNNYNAGDPNSTVTEPLGGPLTLAYSGAPGTQGGPTLVSNLGTEFNPFAPGATPIQVTLTAAPGGNLIPNYDTSSAGVAETYISLNGTTGRADNDGAARITMQLDNENEMTLAIKNSANATDWNYTIFNPAGTSPLPEGTNIGNIKVTSMFMYVDGSQESTDHLYLNFGETWLNTTNGATSTYTYENRLNISTPWDIGNGTDGVNTYDGQSQATLDLIKSGYANGGALATEVLNSQFNFLSNESVAIGQITDLVTYTWNNTGATAAADGQTWDVGTNANWVNMAAVNNTTPTNTYLDGPTVAVQFTDQNNGHYHVTLNTTVTPGSVLFSNVTGNYTLSGTGGIAGSGSLTKSGAGTVTLSTSNTYSGGTTVSAGALIIAPTATPATTSALGKGSLTINNALVSLSTNATLGSQKTPTPASSISITSLAINGTGQLDINNNHIIINYGAGADPIASIAAMIKSGFNAGAWTGPGIMSTTAQTNGGSYGIGYADSADPGNPAGLASGQIEVEYTLLGDANLDGAVNGSDFAILATNFNKAVSGWDQGDFNYDGAANGADFALLATNFNKGASQAADSAAVDAFASANGLLTSVPEPASLGLLLLGATSLVGRRRRSC